MRHRWVPDTKIHWPTDHPSHNTFNLNFKEVSPSNGTNRFVPPLAL
jgi:hypothetical protein